MSGVSDPQPRLVLENFIGGKFVACKSHIDSYNPSTGEVYCSVPDSGPEEVGDQRSRGGANSENLLEIQYKFSING